MSVTEEQIVKPVVDREGWGAGEWDGETDYETWRSESVPCIARRNHLGAWCGYVGVEPGHPWHGKGWDDINPDCHGGMTYGDKCAPEAGICHVPAPGESDDLWWVGFDCAHGGDFVPGMVATLRAARRDREAKPEGSLSEATLAFGASLFEGTYRNLAYVKLNVEGLARQAREAAGLRRIVRPATRRLHAHHHDYSRARWLDVEWLCSACHARRHRADDALDRFQADEQAVRRLVP